MTKGKTQKIHIFDKHTAHFDKHYAHFDNNFTTVFKTLSRIPFICILFVSMDILTDIFKRELQK